MNHKSVFGKMLVASVITALLSFNSFTVEAAPAKKSYKNPYPVPQQTQQQRSQKRPQTTSRPAINKPKPSAAQHRTQKPKPNITQQKVQKPKQSATQPKIQNPKPDITQQKIHKPKPAVTQQKTQKPKSDVTQQKTQKPKPDATQQKTIKPKPDITQQKVQKTETNKSRPKVHRLHTKDMNPKANHIKSAHPHPSAHLSKHQITNQTVHRHWKQKHIGPRRDLYRPPTHKFSSYSHHTWRHTPRPPKDHWWNHRPAHRRGGYGGYYNGIYYNDVVATLLAAEIIHSSMPTNNQVTVVKYEDSSNHIFIPKEAVQYNGHHYHVFSDIGNSMEEAQQFCESMGGHLAIVGDDEKNGRLFRLINESGYDNQYFNTYGQNRLIPEEPITYEKVPSNNSSGEYDEYYGMYYWKYENLRTDGTRAGTGGNAFVCEWDC